MAKVIDAPTTWGFVDAITESSGAKPSQEAIVTVSRRDGSGKVWVRFDGQTRDTPVAVELQRVSVGERCKVSVHGGRVTIVGNSSSPAVGSDAVDEAIAPTKKVAETSVFMAREAKLAANSAISDAGIARASADTAVRDAATAKVSADSAVADAASAKASAQVAQDAAGVAQQEAEAASASAAQANTAANDALTQLGVVQDVTGTLAWVTEHGTYEKTKDTSVQDGKAYFVRTGSEPYTYVAVSDPKDADIANYYELTIDEALSQYVSSHLALTDAGLYVTKDASGYRVLLANDGMSVVDPQGHTVAKYGEGTTFAADRDWYVGSSKAFVFYDASEGTLQIGGSDVTIGGKAPADLLTSLDVSVTQTSTGADITVNGDTVSITNGQNGTDGKTYYTHIRYSESADGTGHVASPTASTVYIGTYTGTSSTAPSSKTSYKWSKYVGKDGNDAAPLTVTATSTEYQLSTSGTEVPTGEWSATPLAPTQTEFLWTKTTLTFSDGTTATSYSVGGLAGAKGDKGDQGDTGPEGIVSVTPDAIDWDASTATLRATLWVNGEDVHPTAWSWTKNLDSTVLGTGQTLEVTDLDATYRCTVTW